MTTSVGIMQHAFKNIPSRRFGYCLDDNARALILSILAYKNYRDKKFLDLSHRYLNFIKFMQRDDGWFHNFLSYNLKFQDEIGSEDSFGRTIWALGFTIYEDINKCLTKKAFKIFQKSKTNFLKLHYLRSKSFATLGLYYFFQCKKDSEIKKIIKKYADDLYNSFQKNKSKNWLWYENVLTYANAVLPSALILSSKILKNKKYLRVGLRSFDFLLKICKVNQMPAVIGNRGWYYRGKKKSIYDQQPIDSAWMILASCEAYESTKKKKYFKSALFWFSWFWGNNILNKVMIDKKTGGVYDGSHFKKLNPNQGAESTICYLIALLRLKEIQKKLK